MTAQLLPPNASPLERAFESVSARLSELPVPLRNLVDPDLCPIDHLPHLAWALSIDAWSSDWPEAIKRARVRYAIEIQRRKGTSESVRTVVESFGGAVALREWWQTTPAGDPYTFSLIVNLTGEGGAPATAAFADAVISEVRRTKPVRAHFTYTQGVAFARRLGVIAAARPALFVRLKFAA